MNLTLPNHRLWESEVHLNSIAYQNRNKTVIYRKRFKYGSLNPISEDIRVFLLQPSPDNNLTSSSISKNLCDEDSPCFDVQIKDKTIRLNFSKVDNVFRVDKIIR